MDIYGVKSIIFFSDFFFRKLFVGSIDPLFIHHRCKYIGKKGFLLYIHSLWGD